MALEYLNSLFGNNTEQWGMSSIGNEWGLSLPEIHPETNMTPVPENFYDTSSAVNNSGLKQALAASMFMSTLSNSPSGSNALPYGVNMNSGGNLDKFGNAMLVSSFFADTKEKAQKGLFMGAALKTAASAGNLFNSLLSMGLNYNLIDKQKKNTKMSVENRMQALDNQVLYYKNQITDKFNTLMARNTVTMAAKNLRVSTGALLEESKDAAYDATKDIQMLESNAELKKIALRNEEKQAKISAKLAKSQLVTNVIQGFADLGLNVATAGGTMESWGDLTAPWNPTEEQAAQGITWFDNFFKG